MIIIPPKKINKIASINHFEKTNDRLIPTRSEIEINIRHRKIGFEEESEANRLNKKKNDNR